ncbi:class I SAM-dependent methyltransferase [Natronoarchaeum mannanilyticum]|uniref:Methyltransferase domain-containing protein n=1 Tax=Natronoarchaeum mannanilyticum TaxID=926360 RepID=A0AAV3T7S6_9EURY
MGFHTFDPAGADRLEDPTRFRFCSREELLAALDPDPSATVADLGSGTGFYTDEVAPFVGRLYGVDVQEEMHARYRENGVPEAVELVTANVEELPFEDAELDAAFSTMTFHEFASADALVEIRRALASGGRLVTVDWSASGDGEAGPPVAERYDAAAAASMLEDAGFALERVEERPETLLVVATA